MPKEKLPEDEPFSYDREGMGQTFSNFVWISLNAEEAVLDFAFRVTTEPTKVKVLHRIVLTIPHLRRMHEVLGKRIEELDALIKQAPKKEEGADGVSE